MKPITISPLTGVLDLRSTPDLIPAGGVRMRMNLQTTAEGKLSRGCGWSKLLTQANYNNTDFHDQLLTFDGVTDSCDVIGLVGGGGTLFECYADGVYEGSMPVAGTGLDAIYVGDGP